ncbi:MAG: hypothetical protein SPL58_05860 [Bacteroidaceae bacterium]|nr:hypothetical protein [Bacteroidaceae bacterium]
MMEAMKIRRKILGQSKRAGLKKWQHWQKYKIGKLEEGSPNQEKSSGL